MEDGSAVRIRDLPFEAHTPFLLFGTITTSDDVFAEPLALEVSSSKISAEVGISGRLSHFPATIGDVGSSKYCRMPSLSR